MSGSYTKQDLFRLAMLPAIFWAMTNMALAQSGSQAGQSQDSTQSSSASDASDEASSSSSDSIQSNPRAASGLRVATRRSEAGIDRRRLNPREGQGLRVTTRRSDESSDASDAEADFSDPSGASAGDSIADKPDAVQLNPREGQGLRVTTRRSEESEDESGPESVQRNHRAADGLRLVGRRSEEDNDDDGADYVSGNPQDGGILRSFSGRGDLGSSDEPPISSGPDATQGNPHAASGSPVSGSMRMPTGFGHDVHEVDDIDSGVYSPAESVGEESASSGQNSVQRNPRAASGDPVSGSMRMPTGFGDDVVGEQESLLALEHQVLDLSAESAGQNLSFESVSDSAGVDISFEIDFPVREAGMRYALLGSLSLGGATSDNAFDLLPVQDRLYRRMAAGNYPRGIHNAQGFLDADGDAEVEFVLSAGALSGRVGTRIYLWAVSLNHGSQEPRMSTGFLALDIEP